MLIDFVRHGSGDFPGDKLGASADFAKCWGGKLLGNGIGIHPSDYRRRGMRLSTSGSICTQNFDRLKALRSSGSDENAAFAE